PYLVLENGILNTDTGQLELHSHEFYSMNGLSVTFDPNAACPNFRRFLDEVLHHDDVAVLQEWMGYCLHRGYPAQVAILFVGEGNNGKSTLISVFQSVLGREN